MSRLTGVSGKPAFWEGERPREPKPSRECWRNRAREDTHPPSKPRAENGQQGWAPAATNLMESAPERAALCRAHVRRALVRHGPGEPPREPRSQLRFPRPFVPTTPPDQCCRYWFAHYCSCRVHCCFLAGFIGAVLDPLCRFRGEAACLHPIQRKTVGKVAGNRGEWGSGVLEWWSPPSAVLRRTGAGAMRKEVKDEQEKNGVLKPASDPIRAPASWSAVGEG